MRKVHVVWAISLLTVTALAASAETHAPQPLAPTGTVVGGGYSPDGIPRASYVIDDPQPLPPPIVDDTTYHAPIIFYVNKNGGTYVPGSNDARTNRSTIVGTTRTVPPWNVSANGWQQVMSCMTTMFSRWNVVITDVDPGNVPHYELVTAGRPQDIGMQQGVGGVSPFSCGVIQNSIVFTFAVVYGSDYRSVCETNAQEIAHSFGLDHQRNCQDPMTYLTGCGNKSFQNVAAACGEYSNRACQCGGNTQNSVALLDQRLGLAVPGGNIDAGPGPGPDAGPTPAPDAGPTPSTDAGPTPSPDAGGQPSDPDAGGNPGDPDAGPGQSDEISAGCGCASGSGDGIPPTLLLTLAVLLILRSRSRARAPL
jgi:MYXO-CTERM domain-containing protein